MKTWIQIFKDKQASSFIVAFSFNFLAKGKLSNLETKKLQQVLIFLALVSYPFYSYPDVRDL